MDVALDTTEMGKSAGDPVKRKTPAVEVPGFFYAVIVRLRRRVSAAGDTVRPVWAIR